jgi:signal transduction histidine kinase
MTTNSDEIPGATRLQQDDPGASLGRSAVVALIHVAAAAGVTVLVCFLIWEFIEQRFATGDANAHLMHYLRGISSSLITAAVAAWVANRHYMARNALLEAEVDHRTAESDKVRGLLELVVDTTPASMIVLDDELRIVQANRTAERLHGIKLTGEPCYEVLQGRESLCEDCPAVQTLAGDVPTKAAMLHRDDRTGELLQVETHPLAWGDDKQYVLLVERAVTEQKKLEARLLHQEKMAAFGLFAAEVAHDLGNPLACIDAQLQLVDDALLPEEEAEAISSVRHEVRRLHRILRELVDFARKRRDEPALISVVAVIEDALRLLRHDRRMAEVRVIRDFDPAVPPVDIVEDHLMQVVLNLLVNALDAMPSGGELRVEVRPVKQQVALRFHDNGEGMELDVLEQCIEPLFTTKEEGKGTGLGLSIARDIIEAAGGGLELHSTLGQGTTAIVALPQAIDSEAPAEHAEAVM